MAPTGHLPGLRVHDHGLGRGVDGLHGLTVLPGLPRIHHPQGGRGVHGALEHGQGDGPGLVVQGRGGHPPHRAGTTLRVDRRAESGQGVLRAVQVQEGQAPRRVAQVVHAGHGLLTLVAALGQVHGGAHQIQLVRDGPLVDLPGGARAPLLDAQGLRGPQPGPAQRRRVRIGQARQLRQPLARHQGLVPGALGPGVLRGGGVAGAAGYDAGPRVPPHQRQLRFTRAGQEGRQHGGLPRVHAQPHHGPVRGGRADLHPQHEAHRVQERRQRLLLPRLHDQQDPVLADDRVGDVLESPLRGEQGQLRGGAGRQAGEHLGGQGGQPAGPVLPRHLDDAQVG